MRAPLAVLLVLVASLSAEAQTPPVNWAKPAETDQFSKAAEAYQRAKDRAERNRQEAERIKQESERIRVEEERNRIQAERVRLEALRPDVQAPAPAGDPRYLEAQIQADLVELFGPELAVKVRPVLERLIKNIIAQGKN